MASRPYELIGSISRADIWGLSKAAGSGSHAPVCQEIGDNHGLQAGLNDCRNPLTRQH
jgi:hypothetical protein